MSSVWSTVVWLESLSFSMLEQLEKRIKPRNIKVLRSGVKLPVANMLKSTGEEFKRLLRRGGNS
ncbi:Mitochodrial transcription termination factor-related protein [Gossypium australe]|uniref:Mitochodrial transcription termination factor-related protein n=1 Tax=Gossypium australe TaxID=47621 RepID=A0A5B6X4R8_9ROSI|nr:Mitochodrial transcription termination factor-related protein [Gossypium australe]